MKVRFFFILATTAALSPARSEVFVVNEIYDIARITTGGISDSELFSQILPSPITLRKGDTLDLTVRFNGNGVVSARGEGDIWVGLPNFTSAGSLYSQTTSSIINPSSNIKNDMSELSVNNFCCSAGSAIVSGHYRLDDELISFSGIRQVFTFTDGVADEYIYSRVSVSHYSGYIGAIAPNSLADLSGAAYWPEDNASLPSGYSLLRSSQSNGKGFSASAYINGDEVVIAFRGTQSKAIGGFKDAVADRSFLTGTPSIALALYLDYAADFVQSIKDENPDKHISLTGHSLGGAIANLVGTASGLESISFDAPGAAGLQRFASLQLCLTNDFCGFGGTPVTEYRLLGDVVSQVGQHYGNVLTVRPMGVQDQTFDLFKALQYHHIDSLSSILDSGSTLESGVTGERVNFVILGLGGGLVEEFSLVPVEAFISVFLDPPPAGGYEFQSTSESPFLYSLRMPAIDGIEMFGVSLWSGDYWSDPTLFRQMDYFRFDTGVRNFRLFGFDAHGFRTNFSDSIILDLAFESSGLFSGTLAALPALGGNSVPEPQIWNLLIIGFAAVGIAHRRKVEKMRS